MALLLLGALAGLLAAALGVAVTLRLRAPRIAREEYARTLAVHHNGYVAGLRCAADVAAGLAHVTRHGPSSSAFAIVADATARAAAVVDGAFILDADRDVVRALAGLRHIDLAAVTPRIPTAATAPEDSCP
jgi:hypothetical protein